MRGAGAVCWLACACAGAPTPTPAPTPIPIASATAAPEPAPLPSADAGAPEAPPPDPGPKTGIHRWLVPLGGSVGSCTLALRGALFSENESTWFMAGIDRVETELGGGCAAAIVYEAKREDDYLSGGPIAKPGRLAEASADAGGPLGGFLLDMSFDGILDLCLTAGVGAYAYSQQCWVFDPKQRAFVREPELDEMQWLEVDATNRRLSASFRVGGPEYRRLEKGWVGGELVTLRTVTTILGETPRGKPLPKGTSTWEIVYERRGKRLVKVSEGAKP